MGWYAERVATVAVVKLITSTLFLPFFRLLYAHASRIDAWMTESIRNSHGRGYRMVDSRPILLLLPDVVLVDVSRGHRVRDMDGDDRS